MNHFMLPVWNGEGLPTPRYGNVAINALIKRLQGFGCLTTRLQAKLFGGAAMWDTGNSLVPVGEQNIDLALQMLEHYGIPVVAKDLGGSTSRKIIFCTETGDVLLRRQHSTLQSERRSGNETAVSSPIGSNAA
jgi:chemotaxis protein CheD